MSIKFAFLRLKTRGWLTLNRSCALSRRIRSLLSGKQLWRTFARALTGLSTVFRICDEFIDNELQIFRNSSSRWFPCVPIDSHAFPSVPTVDQWHGTCDRRQAWKRLLVIPIYFQSKIFLELVGGFREICRQ